MRHQFSTESTRAVVAVIEASSDTFLKGCIQFAPDGFPDLSCTNMLILRSEHLLMDANPRWIFGEVCEILYERKLIDDAEFERYQEIF